MKKFKQFVDEAVAKKPAGPMPVVQDYLKHVANGVNSKNPGEAKKHLGKIKATYAVMNAKAKSQIGKHLPADHKEWLHRKLSQEV